MSEPLVVIGNGMAAARFADELSKRALGRYAIAVVGEVTVDRLWHAVPSFPTVSEVWLRLLEAYGL